MWGSSGTAYNPSSYRMPLSFALLRGAIESFSINALNTMLSFIDNADSAETRSLYCGHFASKISPCPPGRAKLCRSWFLIEVLLHCFGAVCKCVCLFVYLSIFVIFDYIFIYIFSYLFIPLWWWMVGVGVGDGAIYRECTVHLIVPAHLHLQSPEWR